MNPTFIPPKVQDEADENLIQINRVFGFRKFIGFKIKKNKNFRKKNYLHQLISPQMTLTNDPLTNNANM